MKKLIAAIVAVVGLVGLTGCDQYVTKRFGGTTELKIPEGSRLVSVTWKLDNIWYLVYFEETNTCYFNESTNMGVLEGSVVIKNCNPLTVQKD
jgi:hypothetical protein